MRLPPFGRDVSRNPDNTEIFIYAGTSAWMAGQARAKHVGRNVVLVLPPGEDFRTYRWPVRNVPVLLLWPDGDLADVQNFAVHLVQCGSPRVVAPHKKDPELCVFARPESATA